MINAGHPATLVAFFEPTVNIPQHDEHDEHDTNAAENGRAIGALAQLLV